ncbi:hypothetical protein N7478_012399 [Penicillium angulare]|uniref:uncharacterized protein n=1 Tax=Penicillium angulare TaxID=116970 RepID=UPI0025408CF8|nr:uncharacterized protein N7478_012399 [Penicillium angulare]KAJ5259418.1 hypothetical protein N7478_012399 [Penicillium angulare]
MAQQNRSTHGLSPLNTAEVTAARSVPRELKSAHLSPITERNSTDTNHEIETPLKNEIPTLRIASSAERFIMGDDASSIPLLSRRKEMRSDGVFYPRTMRNASPLSEVSTSTVRGEERSNSPKRRVHPHSYPVKRSSPTKSIHPTPRSSTDTSSLGYSNSEVTNTRSVSEVRRGTVDTAIPGPVHTLPPRTSSMNVISRSAHFLHHSKSFQNSRSHSIPNSSSITMIGASQSVNFLDICHSHPELEGTVIQTNVVKAPEPRMTRVMGNLRNAFTRGRSDKKSVSSPLFEIVNQRPQISRPLAPPSPLATSDPKSSVSLSPNGPNVRPSHSASQQQIRQEISQIKATGTETVCRTLNALGRRLVEDDDINRRRVWYREFVQLSNLLADFNSRDARIGEAASHVSQMRAEAALHRYAMLLQVHQALQDNDALETTIQSVDLPTDRIVEEWDH